MSYFVYILLCKDKTLYTGITTDVQRRFLEHKKGIGSRYVKSHKAVKIVYIEKSKNRSTASKRESAIKKLDRSQKHLLIEKF